MPRSDDYSFGPFVPHLVQREDHPVISRGPIHSSIGERLSPVSEFLQKMPPPYRDDRMEVDRVVAMPPAITRPSPYGSVHRMTGLDQNDSQPPRIPSGFQSPYSPSQSNPGHGTIRSPPDPSGFPTRPNFPETNVRPQSSASDYPWDTSYQASPDRLDYEDQSSPKRSTITVPGPLGNKERSKRYRGGRDEFEGSVQYLQKPPRNVPEPRERDLPPLPLHLDNAEQDHVLTQVNQRLSQCAFDFVALYRFPIPIEPNKPAVQVAADKGWTEWAYLLKRLATKRKIPSHAIYQGQIKELTTVLDNSLEMRHATKPQPRALKDDRTVLQFISAGIQVGKMLKDASTMEYLDKLYRQTEKVIQEKSEPTQAYR